MATANALDIDTSASAMQLAETIFGSGVTVVSATYDGDPISAGIYSGADLTMPGVAPSDSGIILSTGNAHHITNNSGTSDTNVSGGTSYDSAGVDGDSDLNAAAGQYTYDGAILNVTFIPDGDYITMQFVFLSEEYPEYVNANFNDAFGVWVNGEYVELTLTTAGNVAIDTVNDHSNQNLYIDNTQDQFNTEMDGFTHILSFKAKVNPGQENTIKIGIADAGDTAYDSNVMIAAQSVQVVALAYDDMVQMTPNSTKVVDVLANDRDLTETGLTITHVMGIEIAPGQTVTLQTGEQVTLNPDGTLTITNDSDIGTNVITYTIQDGAGNIDHGYIEIKTVPVVAPDGIVQGTDGGDLIDLNYTGDPDGDMIDNNDALGVGGTTGNGDYILAGDGDDTVYAGAGDDIAYLGDGDDVYRQDTGGNDSVFGGAGNDTIDGGVGNDLIEGGTGKDVLNGGVGNDTVYGGGDADVLDGGVGDDYLSGGAGDDTITGGAGADRIYGGDDRDVIYGGPGDVVDGGEGGIDFDTLIVNDVSSIEYSSGNPENGIVIFNNGTILEFSNIEKIIADGVEHYADRDGIVSGTDGDDLIDNDYTGDPHGDMVDHGDAVLPGAAPEDDLIHGLNGNDEIYAGLGNDKVFGGNDDDTVFGGVGSDTLFGDAGHDFLYGDEGNDEIDGGHGDDLLYGGDGNDTIYGGVGNDTIFGGIGADSLSGGDDRDDFIIRAGEGIGSTIDGGEGGDDLDTLDLSDWPSGQVVVTYDDDNPENGVVQFFDEDGNPIGDLRFTNIENVIAPPPCFTPGTLIATARGEVKVEELEVGDMVLTRDNGYQSLRWIGQRSFSLAEVAAQPKLAPVCISAGSLGVNLPERDMRVSPQHRMLMTGARAELLFGEHEVLVAALHLVGRPGIKQQGVGPVTYLHLLFDAHEIIRADGAWTESYQPGVQTLEGIDDPQREELLSIFPELREGKLYPAARLSLKRHEVALLDAA